MSQLIEPENLVACEYVPRQRVGPQATASLLGGILWLCLLAILLVIVLKRPAGSGADATLGVLGGSSIIGIFAIAYGVALLRIPRRVTVDQESVFVEGYLSHTEIHWARIATIQRDMASPLMRPFAVDVLVLIDERGKTLARLVDIFDDFASLVRVIETMSAKARKTDAPAASAKADSSPVHANTDHAKV